MKEEEEDERISFSFIFWLLQSQPDDWSFVDDYERRGRWIEERKTDKSRTEKERERGNS